MLSGEVKDSPLPLLRFIDLGSCTSETACAARINCRRHRLPLTGGPTTLKQPDARACAIITARKPKGRGAPSCPPPTSPTTCVAAPLEKARPLRTIIAMCI
jgi:hypothetical protein